MNSLAYLKTLGNGNAVLTFPIAGHVFNFERINHTTLRIHSVDTLPGVEREYDECTSEEELPECLRGTLSRRGFALRSTKTTLKGAM